MRLFPWVGKKDAAPAIQQKSMDFSGYTLFFNNNGVFLFDSYNVEQIIRNYSGIAPLNTAINRIANGVSGLPLILMDKKTGAIVEKHDILSVLQSPNNEEQRTRKDFFRDLSIWKVLEGNAYLTCVVGTKGKPITLSVMQPQNITINQDKYGYPYEYVYNTGFVCTTYRRNYSTNRFIEVNGTAELLHIRNFNPRYSSGNLKGMSEVTPLYYEINQYLQASNHNLQLLTNGARPSGAMVLKSKDGDNSTLSEETFQRLKRQLDEDYTGSANSGRPLLLEGGLEWQEMSISPKDMDFTTGKDKAEQQIYKALGVPIQLVMDIGTTYNNKQEAKLEFYEDRIIPFMEDILNSLNAWFVPMFAGSDNLELTIDRKNIDALSIKFAERRESIEKSPIMTINEKRKELGFAPEKDGDKIVTQNGFAFAGKDAATAVQPSNSQSDQSPQKKTFEIKQKDGDFIVSDEEIERIVNKAIDSAPFFVSSSAAFSVILRELVKEFGTDVVEEIGKESAFRNTKAVEDFINEHSAELIKGLNDTTKGDIKRVIQNAVTGKETLEQLRNNIYAVFEGASVTRAAMIAETESTHAAGFAAYEAITQAGLDKSVWITVRDGKARDSHRKLDGTLCDADGYFHIGDDKSRYPGGFSKAKNSVRCRCAMRAYIDGEKSLGMTEQQETELWHKREAKRVMESDKVLDFAVEFFDTQQDIVLGMFDKFLGVR